jgi:hypothetical protein
VIRRAAVHILAALFTIVWWPIGWWDDHQHGDPWETDQ